MVLAVCKICRTKYHHNIFMFFKLLFAHVYLELHFSVCYNDNI